MDMTFQTTSGKAVDLLQAIMNFSEFMALLQSMGISSLPTAKPGF